MFIGFCTQARMEKSVSIESFGILTLSDDGAFGPLSGEDLKQVRILTAWPKLASEIMIANTLHCNSSKLGKNHLIDFLICIGDKQR